MHIKEKTYQNRRDFKAIFECQDCGHKVEKWGYDDRFFHDEVVPGMKCPECGKSSIDLGITNDFVQTKYPEGFQI